MATLTTAIHTDPEDRFEPGFSFESQGTTRRCVRIGGVTIYGTPESLAVLFRDIADKLAEYLPKPVSHLEIAVSEGWPFYNTGESS